MWAALQRPGATSWCPGDQSLDASKWKLPDWEWFLGCPRFGPGTCPDSSSAFVYSVGGDPSSRKLLDSKTQLEAAPKNYLTSEIGVGFLLLSLNPPTQKGWLVSCRLPFTPPKRESDSCQESRMSHEWLLR